MVSANEPTYLQATDGYFWLEAEDSTSIDVGYNYNLQNAMFSGGMAISIAGSSRPASGSEHLFSHALDKILDKPALHGEQCGLGTIMMMYLHGGDWKAIQESLKSVQAPTTAKELNIADEDIIEALMMAHKSGLKDIPFWEITESQKKRHMNLLIRQR